MPFEQTICLLNGEIQDRLSIFDRGLQYGDGLFETVAINRQQPLNFSRHIQRLQLGCQRLSIPFEQWQWLVDQSLRAIGNCARGVLKIIVTRGVGGRGYQVPTEQQANTLIYLSAWPNDSIQSSQQGIKLGLCQTRLAQQPLLAGLKHLNRLEQVLASQEQQIQGFPESLMLDQQQQVISGIRSNVFVIKNNQLYTPDLRQAGIAGTVRQAIIDYGHCQVVPLKISDVQQADAVFISNSIFGCWPITEFMGYQYAISSGLRQLQQRLREDKIIV